MHVYFSGIGGVAIGPLALICRNAGYQVSGSDLQQSRFTDILKGLGIDFAIGQDGSHIAAVHAQQPIDWLVISAAVPADHPEVQFAKAHGIKVTKRADMINHILRQEKLKLIAVSGTHGKTTVTAMLVWLFKQFSIPVSYSIGTNISFGQSGAYQAGSQYFVYECDEFDRNMLQFNPYLSLITNVDYDHPDIYPTKADYDQAFVQFTQQSSLAVMWYEDLERLHLAPEEIVVITTDDMEISALRLAGQHNRLNAWQAIQAFGRLFPEHPLEKLIEAMNEFPGTDRRFERLAANLYTDYAHHPTEIRATLQTARELSDSVVAVYQPHQNIRQHQIVDEYQDCFAYAKKVFWLPTYQSREDPSLPILTPEELIRHLTNPAIAEPADMNEQLISDIKQALKQGSTVVCMGAGSVDGWVRDHLTELS